MVFPPSGRILGRIWFSYFSLSTLHLFRNCFFFLATVICQKLDYTICNKELTLKLTEDINRHLRTLRWPVRDMAIRDQFSCFKFQTYKLEILSFETRNFAFTNSDEISSLETGQCKNADCRLGLKCRLLL